MNYKIQAMNLNALNFIKSTYTIEKTNIQYRYAFHIGMAPIGFSSLNEKVI